MPNPKGEEREESAGSATNMSYRSTAYRVLVFGNLDFGVWHFAALPR